MTAKLFAEVLADLAAEGEFLEALAANLEPEQWKQLTTAEGWTVAHQIGHLAWTDQAVLLAIRDPAGFATLVEEAFAEGGDLVDEAAAEAAGQPPEVVLEAWRAGRHELAETLGGLNTDATIAWFGPPMSPVSMATARLMETWAHGHDIADGLGIETPRTDRVRHICHLGVRTRGFAFAVRGLEVPTEPVRVELRGPHGQMWTWGPDDAADTVTGDAWDFALLATRRRHRSDVDVHATGELADQWLDIVQAFAGPPGRDPEPQGGQL